MNAKEKDMYDEVRISTLKNHVNLSKNKCVSYLPFKFIENVLGISINDYIKYTNRFGNCHFLTENNETFLEDGAVYSYIPQFVQEIINENINSVIKMNLPTHPTEFMKAISKEWFESDSEIIPILRKMFGD